MAGEPQTLRIGSRASPLAKIQAKNFGNALMKIHPHITVEYVTLRTSGDKFSTQRLSTIGGKGLFTKELEEALLSHEIDLAVHSLKDMATKLPPHLILGAILPREDPRDAFLSQDVHSFLELPRYSVIGTSSLRREAFCRYWRPDLRVIPFRGNVETRLRKLSEGEANGTFLAAAGLKRLALEDSIQEILEPERMLPAVAQGCLAIECCEQDESLVDLLRPLHHEKSFYEVKAERAFLRELDGSCRTPIAALAITEGDQLYLRGAVIRPDGGEIIKEEIRGATNDHTLLGLEIAKKIRVNVGERLQREFRILD